jgi:hypothetical protein
VATKAQIEMHIQELEEFERLYGEFLTERGKHMTQEVGRPGSTWSEQQLAERARELQMRAPRADAAMKASGVGQLMITHPPAMGGGVKSTDLPSQIFDFENELMGTGDNIQWQILQRIPAQIGGLHMRLQEASEKPEPKPKRQKEPRNGGPVSGLWHEPNPWVLVVVGTVVATIIAALLIAKFS